MSKKSENKSNTVLSNDGKGEFVLSPNTKGQVLVYERAYEDAAVDPRDVDYIECHATGTPKGDNVELGSMDTFFSRFPRKEGSENGSKPLLGSVKSNLGHLLTAAGMPGMTKAIWALNEAKIPGTINLNEPLSSKKGYLGGEQMPTETIDWPAPSNASSKPRTAGVSVFGFGGSNAHLVLQQPTQQLAATITQAKARESLAIIGMDAHFGHAKALHDSLITKFVELPEAPELIAPLLYTIPLQLLSYHVAVLKGTDIDQPRNLAKSVTVE